MTRIIGAFLLLTLMGAQGGAESSPAGDAVVDINTAVWANYPNDIELDVQCDAQSVAAPWTANLAVIISGRFMDINRRRHTRHNLVQVSALPAVGQAGQKGTMKIQALLNKADIQKLITVIEEESSQTTEELGFDDKIEALWMVASASIKDSARPQENSDSDEVKRAHTTPGK